METIFFVAILAVLIGGFGAMWFFFKKTEKKPDNQGMLLIQNQLNELGRTIDQKLNATHEATRVQFSESQKLIRDVESKFVKLDEANKQVLGFGEQLKQFQDILQNPKRRGTLGEYQLETILGNILPPGQYQMQYPFKDGTIVDAVIFYQDKIIPVDSKFSLENYRRVLDATDEESRTRHAEALKRDLKTRIDETSKYIKPDENTMQNALMFIPSEAIYYDLLINKIGAVRENTVDLIEYAEQKHVSIVSPTTFLVMLKIILQGLRQIDFNKSAEEIRKNVFKLGQHMERYVTYMQKLGGHLGTTVKSYNTASKELGKIDKDVLKIGGEGINAELLLVEGPEEEGE